MEMTKRLLAAVSEADCAAMAKEVFSALENLTSHESTAIFDKYSVALRFGCKFDEAACGPSFGARALYEASVKDKERKNAQNQ